MTKKETFIHNSLMQMTLIIQASNNIEDSIEVFMDRGYNSGGDNPITDEDLTSFGITLAQFIQIKQFSDNFILFRNNDIPAQADYGKIFNELRTDK